ncbi:MAG: hypothetical protein ACFBRM_04920 [Pikeienuella sp.]
MGERALFIILLIGAGIIGVLVYLTVDPDPQAGAPGSRGQVTGQGS